MARNYCVARIPAPNGGKACALRALEMLGGLVPLCPEHLSQVESAAVEAAKTKIVYVPTSSPNVVYYMGDPASQTVKIGTSTNFRKRLIGIRAKFPDIVLLAVEPGHFTLESLRHDQFSELRIVQRGQREWFRKAPELMDHVNEIRRQYGDPKLYRFGDDHQRSWVR